MVTRDLAKVETAGSSPVYRSRETLELQGFFCYNNEASGRRIYAVATPLTAGDCEANLRAVNGVASAREYAGGHLPTVNQREICEANLVADGVVASAREYAGGRKIL